MEFLLLQRVFLGAVFLVSISCYSMSTGPYRHSAMPVREVSVTYENVVNVFPLEEIREALTQAWQHGLSPHLFWSEEMERIYLRGGPGRSQLKKRADRGLIRFLTAISIGSVDPETLTYDIKLKRKKFLTPKQLQALVVLSGQKLDLLIESVAVKNPPYMALKKSLSKILPACGNGQWGTLTPTKNILKLGLKDPAVVPLKNRLAFLGYPMMNFDEVVDSDMVNAINDIEWNLRFKPDGALHPAGKVWKFLNTSCRERVRQLQADMEKMRWFPSEFEDRYVFINLAMAYFVLIDQTQSPPFVMSFRTVNGRAERKSPTMTDKVVRVILNPYWIVPPTIFVEDKVTEIRNLPHWQIRHYFESRNYEIWNKSFTRRLDPESIDWWSIDTDLDASVYIRQKPHYWNALGVLKFELTNSFSIYLHDTNQRELLYEPHRLLSSGCIRLEKPLDFAEYLLRGTTWDRTKIEGSVAKPGEVMAKDTAVPVPKSIPVYAVFLTSFQGSDGIIRFAEDSYQQNTEILKRLGGLDSVPLRLREL